MIHAYLRYMYVLEKKKMRCEKSIVGIMKDENETILEGK